MAVLEAFTPIYGPVDSWRYGRSLGVDLLGPVSTCSFDCVYCQLGKIQCNSSTREVRVPTEQIMGALARCAGETIDVITLSGNGEPTLAANLGEVLSELTITVRKPTVVLTNGSLLGDTAVRRELQGADIVAVKLDAVFAGHFFQVNRPVSGLNLIDHLNGLEQFRWMYPGVLAIQTMLLSPFSEEEEATYIRWMERLQPDEIQLNVPSRPRPVEATLDGRGNHAGERPYPVRNLPRASQAYLRQLTERLQRVTDIPIRTR